jgi:hypothetical protein
MRITGKNLACGIVSYCRVDKHDASTTLNSPKDGQRRKNKAYTAFAYSFYHLLHPYVYTSLYLSTSVRDIQHLYSRKRINCLSGVLYWRFLQGSTELLVGGFLLRGNHRMLGVARLLVWYGMNRIGARAWCIAWHRAC